MNFNEILRQELKVLNSKNYETRNNSWLWIKDLHIREIERLCHNLLNYNNEDQDEIDGNLHEIADGLVDVYNHDIVKWLAQDYNRAYIIDQAVEEMGLTEGGILSNIQTGQYYYYRNMLQEIVDAVYENSTVGVK